MRDPFLEGDESHATVLPTPVFVFRVARLLAGNDGRA